jgi:predicted DNA-binding protein with PD1-like motif
MIAFPRMSVVRNIKAKYFTVGDLQMESDSSILERTASAKINRIVIGKLKIGADLLEGIKEIARREKIHTGVLMSGVGALQRAVFRNAKVMPSDYKMDDKYRIYLDIKQPLELVSLPGWIATKADGEIEVHAHFTASLVREDQVVTLGGHLTPGTIASIKVIITIGVIDNPGFKAAVDPMINQMELYF